MIDGFEPPSPQADQRAQRLGEFALAFNVVQKTLRSELSWRQMKLRTANDESERGYWQLRVEDTQKAIDALVRMKDLGKLALLEQSVSVGEEWNQPQLLAGGGVDVKALGY